MTFETNKEKGRAGMALAIGYFGSNGYTVNIPLNDTQWYDLIVEKDNCFYTVQCKATGSKDNTIYLKSSGGTKGTVYDNILDHPLDFLFCLDINENIFIIPVEAIRQSKNTTSITLKTEPNGNGQGFETYIYQVSFFNSTINTTVYPQKKEQPIFYCIEETCNNTVSKRGNRCQSCATKLINTIPLDEMPVTRDELKKLIRSKPFTQIGTLYNISDNAIRKWCKKYNLPSTKTEINSYSENEWNLI